MGDWTPVERKIETPNGPIFYGGPCKDDYPNMEDFDGAGDHLILTLQRPAMKAFKAAQDRYGKRMGWSRSKRERNPDGKPIIVLPGTNRSCSTQTRLYASDPNRYAKPEITGHTRGLAIDVSRAQGNLDIIHACLKAEGWTQTRPDDEPWHYSYGVTI